MTVVFWIIFWFVLVFGFVVFRGAPYVPSKRGDVRQAFTELYPIGRGDTVVDIGSGDGVVLREAARRGAMAVGYELNPVLVVLSKILSRTQPAVRVHLADFWTVSLPKETTVVYTFGDSRDIAKMARKVAETASVLGRPLMFISYGVIIPGLEPIKQVGAHFLYRMEPLQQNEA